MRETPERSNPRRRRRSSTGRTETGWPSAGRPAPPRPPDHRRATPLGARHRSARGSYTMRLLRDLVDELLHAEVKVKLFAPERRSESSAHHRLGEHAPKLGRL